MFYASGETNSFTVSDIVGSADPGIALGSKYGLIHVGGGIQSIPFADFYKQSGA